MKFTIEIPLYAEPFEKIAFYNQNPNLDIRLYGGFPNSPLNGGRNNFTLDGIQAFHDGSNLENIGKFDKAIIKNAKQKLIFSVEQANRNGIPFYLTFTNMFFSEQEWNRENREPIETLISFSKKYAVKNGVISHNLQLEGKCRKRFLNNLDYISSCTKYVTEDRILSSNDTLPQYLHDMKTYNLVNLTPQDSRNTYLIKKLAKVNPNKFAVIVNTYCSNLCNTYWHQFFISRENKIKLEELTPAKLASIWGNFLIYSQNCSVPKELEKPLRIKKILSAQLNSGAINFKVGRGLGQNCLDFLVNFLSYYLTKK